MGWDGEHVVSVLEHKRRSADSIIDGKATEGEEDSVMHLLHQQLLAEGTSYD